MPNIVIDPSNGHALFVIECQCICVSLHSLTPNLSIWEQSLNFVKSTENVEGLPEDAEDDQPWPNLFYDDECDVELSANNKEDGGQAGNSKEAVEEYENQAGVEEVDMHSTETELRQQRRHALATCVREGNRPYAKGLPRIYLLVDVYRKEPYGTGVGAWWNKLMLLLRNLDPSIGNINHQLEEKVRKIAEWIQHTWEYNRLVKWKFVKDVIVHGVSLKLAEMQKRMHLNQEKLEGMDDRIWKLFERKLKSPPMMKKFESCRKANASRMNLERTGPSVEVGVHERLRKRLKKSPSLTR